MARIRIGDVVEIGTKQGFAYALYTHQHKQFGALLRVSGQIFLERPIDLARIFKQVTSFACFFPLKAAVEKGIVSIADNVDVPANLSIFPIFRAGTIDPATKKVAVWWLWDGEQEWRIGTLTEEQRDFPIRGVWNDALLIERIESGWTSRADPSDAAG